MQVITDKNDFKIFRIIIDYCLTAARAATRGQMSCDNYV